MKSLLTKEHEFELCEPRAAGATTLLHALGHSWALILLPVFALSWWMMRVSLSRDVRVCGGSQCTR
jgi:hypothetical protein